jgi:DNA topoisomerase IB
VDLSVAPRAHPGCANHKVGRRQYRYHDAWRVRREREKFERVLSFGQTLPQLRPTWKLGSMKCT